MANLLTGELDEIGASSELALEFKKKFEDLLPFCEQLVSDSFSVAHIRSTTSLNELSNKVDTVIRKNYNLME